MVTFSTKNKIILISKYKEVIIFDANLLIYFIKTSKFLYNARFTNLVLSISFI